VSRPGDESRAFWFYLANALTRMTGQLFPTYVSNATWATRPITKSA